MNYKRNTGRREAQKKKKNSRSPQLCVEIFVILILNCTKKNVFSFDGGAEKNGLLNLLFSIDQTI